MKHLRKAILVAALAVSAQANAFVMQCDYQGTGGAVTGSGVVYYPNEVCDVLGDQIIGEGTKNAYNISAATVVKATPGRLAKVSIITAGSTAGTVNDTTTTGGASAANEIGPLPNTVGTIDFNWPATSGIVVVPGTGQVVAISYQ